jgi:hypothetical protein
MASVPCCVAVTRVTVTLYCRPSGNRHPRPIAKIVGYWCDKTKHTTCRHGIVTLAHPYRSCLRGQVAGGCLPLCRIVQEQQGADEVSVLRYTVSHSIHMFDDVIVA